MMKKGRILFEHAIVHRPILFEIMISNLRTK